MWTSRPRDRTFLESARRIRAEITSALAAVRSAATLQRGRVAVALLPSLAAGWLPGVLAQYRAAHPGIEIDIADVLSEPCIDRVASGHADFALAAIRADTPALQAEPFCSDNFYLVCPADHPLARRRKAITAQDLAAWPFIHLARTSSVRQYLEAALHPQAMHTLMEVEQLATVMGMVRAGLGISVVPALTLFHFDQPAGHAAAVAAGADAADLPGAATGREPVGGGAGAVCAGDGAAALRRPAICYLFNSCQGILNKRLAVIRLKFLQRWRRSTPCAAQSGSRSRASTASSWCSSSSTSAGSNWSWSSGMAKRYSPPSCLRST